MKKLLIRFELMKQQVGTSKKIAAVTAAACVRLAPSLYQFYFGR